MINTTPAPLQKHHYHHHLDFRHVVRWSIQNLIDQRVVGGVETEVYWRVLMRLYSTVRSTLYGETP